jgi:hypothetical protein
MWARIHVKAAAGINEPPPAPESTSPGPRRTLSGSNAPAAGKIVGAHFADAPGAGGVAGLIGAAPSNSSEAHVATSAARI